MNQEIISRKHRKWLDIVILVIILVLFSIFILSQIGSYKVRNENRFQNKDQIITTTVLNPSQNANEIISNPETISLENVAQDILQDIYYDDEQ